MDQTFSAYGLKFSYPADWEVEESREPGRFSVTVSSPATAFWTLYIDFDSPDPEEMLEGAINAYREEYEELDLYESSAAVAAFPTLARDLDFVCHELLNVARIRVFETEDFTAAVVYQLHDKELEENGAALDAVTRSLMWDPEGV